MIFLVLIANKTTQCVEDVAPRSFARFLCSDLFAVFALSLEVQLQLRLRGPFDGSGFDCSSDQLLDKVPLGAGADTNFLDRYLVCVTVAYEQSDRISVVQESGKMI